MIQYVGLDFETSGTEPWGKTVPIQIGLSVGDGDDFASYIGRWDWSQYEWDPESAEVHKISQDTLKMAPAPFYVDIFASYWLVQKLGTNARMWTIPVGFNVAGFDRQFVSRWFPNLNKLLSYRSVDLNAILFFQAGRSEGKYVHLKKDIKRRAAENMPVHDVGEHNAGYDAALAFEVLRLLMLDEIIEPENYPVPKGPEALI